MLWLPVACLTAPYIFGLFLVFDRSDTCVLYIIDRQHTPILKVNLALRISASFSLFSSLKSTNVVR